MVKITGANEHVRRLRGMAGKEAVELVGQALYVGGDMIKTEAQVSLTQGSRSGVFVKQGVKRTNFNRSAPGEPPAYDTMDLQRQIEVERIAPLHVRVSANDPKSVWLEFGTSRILERPFMRPATERKRKEVVALVRKAVTHATRKRK